MIKHIKVMMKKYTTCDLVCVFLVGGLLISIFYLFFTWGEGWKSFLWWDQIDTGMDFFHSIEYVRGRVPYEQFETLYPPLANLFFYVIYRFVPAWQHNMWENTFLDSVGARGTVTDLRIWQPTMILFILFIVLSSVCINMLIRVFIEKYKSGKIVSIGLLLTSGMLYAYERGNIIIAVILLLLFYVENRNSENKLLSELALISLAVAAGIKIYPAFFGVLLIYDKQYKKAIRTIIYGITAFVAPTFAFKEGLNGIFIFFEQLTNYSEINGFSCIGFSADKLLNTLIYIFQSLFVFDVSVNEVMNAATAINIITAITLLIIGFLMKKQWEKILVCSLAILVYQTQYMYILIVLMIPLLVLLKEEEKLTKGNTIVIIGIMLTQILLPLECNIGAVLCNQYIRFQIGEFLLLGYVFYKAITRIVDVYKKSLNSSCSF